MKRYKNLFEKVCSIENLVLADNNARKGKLDKRDVITHLKNEDRNIIKLHFDENAAKNILNEGLKIISGGTLDNTG